MKFAANLTMLFTELPLKERFGAAWSAGFGGVEILFPYDDPVPEMVEMLSRNGLGMALINCPPPNYRGVARGFAAVPGGHARFQQDFRRAVRYAKALGAEHIHIISGIAGGEAAFTTLVSNLAWAAAHAPQQSLTIEPLNTVDMPGYFLDDFHLASRVIAAVDAPNLGLQFDTYHAAMIHGDVMALWEEMRPLVRHVQLGQAPNRSEPGSGDFDFPGFFEKLRRDGYDGWVSGEYAPNRPTHETLGWLPA